MLPTMTEQVVQNDRSRVVFYWRARGCTRLYQINNKTNTVHSSFKYVINIWLCSDILVSILLYWYQLIPINNSDNHLPMQRLCPSDRS
jgi:hypothetical protein